MKQQVAVLIGTLLILPGCAKNDTDTYGSAPGPENETTATGAPASAQSTSANDATGPGSTFDTSGDTNAPLPGANQGAAANTPPPITPPANAATANNSGLNAPPESKPLEESATPNPQ